MLEPTFERSMDGPVMPGITVKIAMPATQTMVAIKVHNNDSNNDYYRINSKSKRKNDNDIFFEHYDNYVMNIVNAAATS